MAAHPALAPLLGTWRGSGHGAFPEAVRFVFDEEVTFSDIGNGDLAYLQRAWDPGSGEVLHAEAGIWRVSEAGLILTVSLPRVVEVSFGTATPNRWETASIEVARAPGGARLVAIRRRYRLEGAELVYEIDLAAGDATEPVPHLVATLRREDRSAQSIVK